MKIGGRDYRAIWRTPDDAAVEVLDQTLLPHRLATKRIETLEGAVESIKTMVVRGAPLIGASAAYGLAIALRARDDEEALDEAYRTLLASRPTAVNLRTALDDVRAVVQHLPARERGAAAWARAGEICEEDVALNLRIGEAGFALIEAAHRASGGIVNILTHCNAGWLATVDWGTATAAIYKAHDCGVNVHVYVDETRPRNQGASLTAWELGNHGVPHTLIVDNAGGHLMRLGMVDLCVVGTDRVAANGDVCNKIGTYLKALAARDNEVPFYVAAPSPSIDFALADGGDIPIEFRGEEEVLEVSGLSAGGDVVSARVAPAGTRALNPGFDVTPARLVTGLITERGVVRPERAAMARAFPERNTSA